MSQDARPHPLTPVDGNLISYPSIMIPRAYLRKLIVKFPKEHAAMLRLVMESWQQLPAGSLPNDDCELAEFAGLSGAPEVFEQIKPTILTDWVECTDGRLYNSPMAETVRKAVAGSIRAIFKNWCGRMRKAPNLPSPNHRFNQPSLEEWLQAGKPGSWPQGYSLKKTNSSGNLQKSTGNEDSSTGIPVEFGLNRNEQNKSKSLSEDCSPEPGEREVEQVHDQGTEGVFRKLVESGWKRNKQEARQIKAAFESLGVEAFNQALDFSKVNCKVWTIDTSSSTSYLLKRAQIMQAQKPPSRVEDPEPSKLQPPSGGEEAERAQAKADAQARSVLQQGVLRLPTHQQSKLMEDFVSSPESKPARKALELNGWYSTSGAVWATLRHWLFKVDRDLLAQLTGEPVSCNVIQLPMPASTTAPEEVDLEGLARIDKLMWRC